MQHILFGHVIELELFVCCSRLGTSILEVNVRGVACYNAEVEHFRTCFVKPSKTLIIRLAYTYVYT